jgi:hypothetical protein
VTYDHGLVVDRGKIRKRTKGASRQFPSAYGHTPLPAAGDIPRRCRRLVIGSGADGRAAGAGRSPQAGSRRGAGLVIVPTAQAVSMLARATKDTGDTSAILHLT